MTTKDALPPYSTINAKLAEIVAQASTPPRWYESWRSLGPESTDRDRLAVYQAVRNAGSLPPEAGLYLVSWQTDMMTAEAAQDELRELDEQLEAIRKAHGVDELERWPAGKEPAAYGELERQFMAAWEDLFVRTLKQHREHDTACLFRQDRAEFDRLHEAGRAFFHGARDGGDELPGWLKVLLDLVADCIEVESTAGPLGVRWGQDEDAWEVTIYPTPVELVGGAVDGEVVAPGFTVDLERLRTAFTRLDAFGWNALGLHGRDGSYVYLEGDFLAHELFLRVLAQAPQDEGPGAKLSV
jgi:hypothetical protein